jgi:hypothetical protein
MTMSRNHPFLTVGVSRRESAAKIFFFIGSGLSGAASLLSVFLSVLSDLCGE